MQLSRRERPGCPHRNRERQGGPPHGSRIASGPGPRFPRTGRVRRESGRRIHTVSAGRRREMRPLWTVYPCVQRNDGPRGHPVFGRGTSREIRTAFDEPTNQCQACGACAFVCPTGAIDLATITSRRTEPHITDFDKYLTPGPASIWHIPRRLRASPSSTAIIASISKPAQCGLCAKVCQAGAIDYDQPEETLRLEVGCGRSHARVRGI